MLCAVCRVPCLLSLVSCIPPPCFLRAWPNGAFWLHPIPDFEEMTGHTAFSRLHNATITKDDPSSGVGDAKQFFASSLRLILSTHVDDLKGAGEESYRKQLLDVLETYYGKLKNKFGTFECVGVMHQQAKERYII